MLKFVKLAFLGLLSLWESLALVAQNSDYTKSISLNNDPSLARPTLVALHSYELHYCSYFVSLDRCNGSCNSFGGL